MLKGIILVQFMSNMSSCRHDSLALHIRHTNILQPHQERLEKSVLSIFLRNVAFFYMELNCSNVNVIGQNILGHRHF